MKQKTKPQAHTPGPWYADTMGYPSIINAGNTENPKPGCIVCIIEDPAGPNTYTSKNDRTNAANARLIAAAPDLLAVASALVNFNNADNPMTEDELQSMASAAITKAEGREGK